MRDERTQLVVQNAEGRMDFSIDHFIVTGRDDNGKATGLAKVGRSSAGTAVFHEDNTVSLGARGCLLDASTAVKAIQRAANNLSKRAALIADAEKVNKAKFNLSEHEKAIIGLMQIGKRVRFEEPEPESTQESE